MDELELFLGPRIPKELWEKEKKKFLLPSIILFFAALLLLISVFLPYWNLTLNAPQYPGGLNVELFVNKVVGDVSEVDGLNHYIGMKPLGEAAPLERSLSVFIIIGIVLLCVGAIFVHSPASLFLSIPAMLYPAFFLGDLYFWMRNFGLNLDQKAPLSGAIKPFVPPLLGEGTIGQFSTVAVWDIGLIISIAASVLILIGLYYHRKAYKPLLDARFVKTDV
ncbi:MAG: cytochrome C [Candidatus Dadabacteria bacterium]|nr:cytochrome C [Candidatus Dadabacteria bacterium]NIQ15448.1 cytochrome C [Candidatus Dadabacteria bacterium]